MASQELPEFALAVRGYDRQQVDDYVRTLRGYVDEMTHRLGDAERARASASPPSAAAAATADIDPVELLGQRVVGILREAQSAANALCADAEREAEAIRQAARTSTRDAGDLLTGARAEADQKMAQSRSDAGALLERARQHAEQQAGELLADAEAEAARLVADAQQRADRTVVSSQQRADTLRAEIADLTERRRRAHETLRQLRDTLADPAGDPDTADLESAAHAETNPARGVAPVTPVRDQDRAAADRGVDDDVDAPTTVLHLGRRPS